MRNLLLAGIVVAAPLAGLQFAHAANAPVAPASTGNGLTSSPTASVQQVGWYGRYGWGYGDPYWGGWHRPYWQRWGYWHPPYWHRWGYWHHPYWLRWAYGYRW